MSQNIINGLIGDREFFLKCKDPENIHPVITRIDEYMRKSAWTFDVFYVRPGWFGLGEPVVKRYCSASLAIRDERSPFIFYSRKSCRGALISSFPNLEGHRCLVTKKDWNEKLHELEFCPRTRPDWWVSWAIENRNPLDYAEDQRLWAEARANYANNNKSDSQAAFMQKMAFIQRQEILRELRDD